MKKHLSFLLGALFVASAQAQPGGPGGMGMSGGPGGAGLPASTIRLFGDNQTFSATLEIQAKGPATGNDSPITVPGKFSFDHGSSRFEMDAGQMKGGNLPAEAAAHMKSMGMDKIIMVSRLDKKVSYMVYPGLQSYVETPLTDKDATTSPADFKMELTELGKETIDGHPCVKNKAVVTDKDGTKHESTVWNATDLSKFPIKFESTEQGTSTTMHFKDVSLDKPDAALFSPPTAFAKYTDMMTMMQQAMMKRMGHGATVPGAPGAVPTPRGQ